jgi:hypothetical protein
MNEERVWLIRAKSRRLSLFSRITLTRLNRRSSNSVRLWRPREGRAWLMRKGPKIWKGL